MYLRWPFLALSLALAACSSDPAVPFDGDAGLNPPFDLGADTPALDAVDVQAVDTQAVDAPDVPDVWAFSEDPAPDRPALPDVQPVDVVDAGPVDVGVDAGDVGGAGDVADVPRVDVPRDAGPVDGGPVVYDLEAGRTGESYRVIVRETFPGGGPGGTTADCDMPPTEMSCSVMAGTLRFAIRSCGTYFTGLFPLSITTGRSLSLFPGSFASTLSLAVGRRVEGSPSRQSFHVQFAYPVGATGYGATGVPGRTVSPALGDLWLLGCASD